MNIDEFVEKYNAAQDSARFLKSQLKTKYIDYEDKVSCCKSIIESSMYKEVYGRRTFVIDSPNRYLLFVIAMTSLYFDIDMPEDGKERMRLFNLLEEHNISTMMASVLGGEYEAFAKTLSVMVDDEIQNNSITAVIDNKFDAFMTLLEGLSNSTQKEVSNEQSI